MVKTAVEIKSEAQFKNLITNAASTVFVLNFWAEWASPCRQMNDVFQELCNKYQNLSFLMIDAEEVSELSEQFEISAVPSFVFYDAVQDKILSRVEGANASQLSQLADTHSKRAEISLLQQPITNIKDTTDSTHDYSNSDGKAIDRNVEMKQRLHALINQERIMLFMKGSPDMPQCGFSRQIVALLRQNNITQFGYFDILQDEVVRQELKVYSDWPTYPQLYVNGELVGGLDIVKEMIQNGEFDSVLKSQ